MTTDPYFPPPPYTPSDPLTPATTQASESPLRPRRGDGQVPVYSPTPTNERVGEERPTFDHAPDSPHFSSAATYFEERGLPTNTHDDVILHQFFISSADTAEDVARIPLCWRNRTNDLTEADMRTFANFLLPPGANFGLLAKLGADIASDEKAPLSPTDTESNAERRARMSLVVAEWNEAFFYPRGLLAELVFVPQHPPHAARGLDPICQSCVAANNSASRYAAQTYHQPLHPPMPHGMGIPPPQPQIPHGPGVFPHGFPHVPPLLPHGPGVFPHGFPPHAPFGRRPFGLSHLRNGIERFASGRGRSWASGPGRGGYCARSRELHSFDHGHHTFHHHNHHRSRSSSSSSSSSSSDSDHHHGHAGRHGGSSRGRGRGRERGRREACERRHERYHRRRGRSSSTSSSSSSSSDSSIDSISSRDVRGLKLEDVIRGVAAVRLGKEGENFGAKMDDVGKKIGFRMEEIGRRIDAKVAVKQLKSGLREMKRENGNSGRGISKDEKKAVKRELKGLKKDLKDQMREVKREKKELKREERYRRRDRRRHGRDKGRRSERRSRGYEGTERGEEDGEGAVRAGMEGQVTGVTTIQDTNPVEWGNSVKS